MIQAKGEPEIILSICIPTFNRSECLLKNLTRLLPEITTDMEIVISDNNSDDNTPYVVDKFIRDNSQECSIRFMRQKENVGFDKNVAAVVDYARGKYCWLLGDDDYLKKGCIQQIINLIKSNNLTFIMTNYSWMVSTNGTLSPPQINGHNQPALFFDNFSKFFFYSSKNSYFYYLGMNILFMSTCIVKKNIWLESFTEVKDYLGIHCIHVFTIINMLMKEPAICFVTDPLIEGTLSNRRVGWGGRLFWLKFMDHLCSFLTICEIEPRQVFQIRKRGVTGLNWRQRIFHYITRIPGGIFMQKIIIYILYFLGL
ncbi:MAG: hypothetical protein Fur0025_40050 [Oscillatoriaceae cyanobacterium]